MFIAVDEYLVDWLPRTNENRIVVKFANSPQLFPVPINTETEFLAVLLMLSKPGVQVDNTTGDIRVPQRKAGT
jgi:hypothetical protein